MKRIGKILCALIPAALLWGAAPVSAFAAEKEGMVVNNWYLDFRGRDRNCADERMGWSWNARSRTLTLENFHIQVPWGAMEEQAAVFLPKDSAVELCGRNTIHTHSFDCTAIYGEGALTFTGRGSLRITTDSRAASGIYVEQGPLAFAESAEVTLDPAGYVFYLHDVKSGGTAVSVQDKAEVIFPDDVEQGVCVTHSSSVRRKDIGFDYDEVVDRRAGTVTLCKRTGEPSAEEPETPEEEQPVEGTSHEYRFTIGSPVLFRDGAAVANAGVSPYLSHGYTMLPLRALQAFAAPEPGKAFRIAWDAANKTAFVQYGGSEGQPVATVYFTLGEPEMTAGGSEAPIPLAVPAERKDGRIFLSLRDWARALETLGIYGCEIRWDAAAKAAVLTVPDQQ